MSYGELSNTQETMVLPMLQMKNIRGKPYITVSAKGMINGLSNIPNDGADFGPDTLQGATAPGQYGAPYSTSLGMNEAVKYGKLHNIGVYYTATKTFSPLKSIYGAINGNIIIATIPVGNNPFGVAITPDGNYAYVANSGSGTVSVIATATNAIIATITVGSGPFDIAITPDGNYAYVTNNSSASVSVIDTNTNTVITTITTPSGPVTIAITPDGNYAYVANISGSVSVINTTTNTIVNTITAGTNPFGVAITPDGNYAYIVNRGSNNISVVDTSTNTVVTTIPVGPTPQNITFTPDGNYAYVTNGGSETLSLIDISSNTVISTIGVGNSPNSIDITPDRNYIYVTNYGSNTVSVIQVNAVTNNWNEIKSKPYPLVTLKGIVNGLSTVLNDGADFGPDTLQGATAPGQYGAPYSTSLGINEAINTLTNGGIIKLMQGTYGITAGILISTPHITIEGIGGLGTTQITVASGTVTSIITSTAYYTTLKNINIYSGTGSGISVGTAIDLSQPSAIATNNNIIDCLVEGTFTDYVVNLNNNDAVYVEDSQLGGTTSATAVVTWLAPGGAKATIANSTIISINIAVQNLMIIGSYIGTIIVPENSTPLMCIDIIQSYMDSEQSMITVGSGVTIAHLSYSGYYQIPNGGYALSGSGTINKMYLNGVALQVVAGSLPAGWAESTLTVVDYPIIDGSFSGQSGETSIPGAPFNISTSGLLIRGTPTAPSVPTSTTAQENTNPYAVDVYVYGGAVTEIQITRNGTAYTVFSVSTAIAMSGQVYKLNPGDSITVTYSTAPSWEWLSD